MVFQTFRPHGVIDLQARNPWRNSPVQPCWAMIQPLVRRMRDEISICCVSSCMFSVCVKSCFFFTTTEDEIMKCPVGPWRQKNESMTLSKNGFGGHVGCSSAVTVLLTTTETQYYNVHASTYMYASLRQQEVVEHDGNPCLCYYTSTKCLNSDIWVRLNMRVSVKYLFFWTF